MFFSCSHSSGSGPQARPQVLPGPAIPMQWRQTAKKGTLSSYCAIALQNYVLLATSKNVSIGILTYRQQNLFLENGYLPPPLKISLQRFPETEENPYLYTLENSNHINDMENRSLVTIAEHSREKILYMIDMAKEFEAHPNRHLLDGRVVATLFFEPSTRTRLSFETAANRLGARVIGFTDPKATSSSKGETLKDTIKMVSNYADIIVMRHYLEGAARYASEVTDVPIVNAGDGANQHPSQTMLDLYSIYKTQGTLENLNIYLVGDLKYGRTVHSLLMAMRHFNPTFHFIAPKELQMPEEYKIYCQEHGIRFEEHTDFNEETIAEADILYMTRVQRERFTDLMEYERVKNVYILRNEMLAHTRPNLRILHPLPRVNEIAYDVDENPKAYYFQQAQNGLYARQAILCDVLGITLDDVRKDGIK